MTLQGNKADGTDLHSKTADMIGISRNEAKVCDTYIYIYSETWITRTAGGHQQSLSYEKFEL